ncbi:probable alpha-ketoglutarate-dependent hypophosphite dioxygenase isoform X1 [Polyodon spathula]|uniref:probable alpha-ketoglutarate-dependent hypophosphite dioxygenase isoform X1 n=1 Tax=Polyodon spathula TaxID=7913 RepID=UPI001B7E8649|nr:probable alpha-ketoglutarate-dependent hypophosphite dioxygenase isoform X1 [Polyodon spathula]
MRTSLTELCATYCDRGFVTGVPVLDTEELERATEGFSRLEREFGLEYTQYSLHNVHLKYRWVMSLATHPKVLELIKGILGPNVILLDSRFICKYPTKQKSPSAACGKKQNSSTLCGELQYQSAPCGGQHNHGLPFVAWHQDIRYWGFEGGSVASVWLALDDVDQENGVLQVIPGSHHQGLLPHITSSNPGNMLTANQEIPEHLLNTSEAVECPLQAGQMSIHDGLTVHASEPNLSTRRRCGFVIRYVPTSAYPVQDPDRPRTFNATVLVSGVDEYHHFPNSAPSLQ